MGEACINSLLLVILIIIAVVGVISCLVLFLKIRDIKLQLSNISDILDDIMEGNINRKILANPHDMTTLICYKINEIVHDFRGQIIELKKTEKANKQLMTSLSHDVRTPLTTLIGYLDAAQKGIVVGEERDKYLEIARRRAYDMKEYVDKLFEWFKLNSDEETFIIRKVEIAELTRNLLKDWIPIFENASLDFNIDIPENRIEVNMDTDAYSRILNNLIQNVISHSKATHIDIRIIFFDMNVRVSVADDGIGIPKQDLQYIFERLYKCDMARSEKGSGLGLSIVKKLVDKMDGSIIVESIPNKITEFNITFPRL